MKKTRHKLYRGFGRSPKQLFIAASIAVLSMPAFAATITVDSAEDNIPGPGPAARGCTLRDAITASETDQHKGACGAGSGTDTIDFNLPPQTTIFLQAQLPMIRRAVSIRGRGANYLFIDGGLAARHFLINAAGDSRIPGSSDVVIRDLTLQNGGGQGDTPNGSGGAIAVTAGTVNLSGIVFSRNVTPFSGGAINIRGGTVNIDNCNFVDNEISTNDSLVGGGAIVAAPGPFSLRISNSSFINNHVRASSTTQQHNNGGAILISPDQTNSPIVNISNSTFGGNSAADDGGAIAFFREAVAGATFTAQATITSVTIVDNTADSDTDGQGNGGGIFIGLGEPTITNSLVARNKDRTPAGSPKQPDVSGTFRSRDFNLIGNGTGGIGFTGPADQVGGPGAARINPRLGSLADNGGFGMTYLPRPNSRAVDKGSCSQGTDQRGVLRPNDLPAKANAVGGNGCDIGAVER